MALYPKQLQLLDESTGYRKSYGETIIYSDGFTPPSDITVNSVIFAIDSTIYGVDLTGITGSIRTRDRYRPFTGSFGDVVVFPGSVAITGDQAANELIEVLRVLWDIENPRTVNKTGKATSVKN